MVVVAVGPRSWSGRRGGWEATLGRCAAFLSLTLALLGCGDRQTPVEAGRVAQILYHGNGVEPQDLDPHLTTGSYEYALHTALFEGLLAFDPVTAQPVAAAAESWHVSEDRLTYTFTLRPGLRWSDGEPVTAHDFVVSFQRALTPTIGAEFATEFHCLVGARAFHHGETTDFSTVGVKAPDDRTVRFSLREPVPHFLSLLPGAAWLPVPRHVLARHDGLARRGSAWTRPGHLVGNGPFVLTTWTPNQRIVVERSPTYWNREQVGLRAIQFLPVDQADTEERMFRAGQLHTTRLVPAAKLEAYRRDQPEVLRIAPERRNFYFVLNVDQPPFDDVRVRRALALVIDREQLVKQVLRAGQTPAWNFTPAQPAGYAAGPRFAESVAEARALLAAAGFPDGAGFPPVSLLFANSERPRLVAEAVQEMWRRTLGVRVELRIEEWKVYLDSMKAGDYQITVDGWAWAHTHQFFDLLTTGNSASYNRWSHPEYDALFARASATLDEAGRHAVYDQMEDLLAREMPVIPVFFSASTHLVHPDVQGWYDSPLDVRMWSLMSLGR